MTDTALKCGVCEEPMVRARHSKHGIYTCKTINCEEIVQIQNSGEVIRLTSFFEKMSLGDDSAVMAATNKRYEVTAHNFVNVLEDEMRQFQFNVAAIVGSGRAQQAQIANLVQSSISKLSELAVSIDQVQPVLDMQIRLSELLASTPSAQGLKEARYAATSD